MQTDSIVLLMLLSISLYVMAQQGDGDKRHIGSQMFRIIPKSDLDIRYLRGLRDSSKFDFFTTSRIAGIPVDIVASRLMIPVLKNFLQQTSMEYEEIIPDLYSIIVKSRMENNFALARSISTLHAGGMDWVAYHNYDEIMAWVDSLATTYPSLATVENIGQSYEGRTMKMVKVSTGGTGKPAIFSDAGIHAREWTAPAILTYIINELLVNNTLYADVLNAVDFYFLPSINPDGYSYSWTNDRLWRKTRSKNGNSDCTGVDPNRNWDFYWNVAGGSSNPCSDTYVGPEPFSEVECRNVRDQMLKYNDTTKVYLSFHSYGQFCLYPWGYDGSQSPDWKDLDDLAKNAFSALTAVRGTHYIIGTAGGALSRTEQRTNKTIFT